MHERVFGVQRHCRGKEQARISKQAKRVKNKNIPEWAQGLYPTAGSFVRILVYYDEEAIYFEHKGKGSGIVRFTFDIIEGLKITDKEGE